jgi:hypothetical protein
MDGQNCALKILSACLRRCDQPVLAGVPQYLAELRPDLAVPKKLLRMLRHHAGQEQAINYMHPGANEFFSVRGTAIRRRPAVAKTAEMAKPAPGGTDDSP